MTRIGFLGLGRMGSAICGRLLGADVSVIGWNRSPTMMVRDLVTAGLQLSADASSALSAPVSMSMLADDGAADAVLSRVNLAGGAAGRIHVNLASISVAMADLLERRFADAGVTYLSAPVLGRPEIASAGKLNVLTAGASDALDKVDPYLAHCSVRRWRLGERPRQANATKIALNFMLLQSLESLGEGIALVESQGIDASGFVELLSSTFFGGMVHTVYGGIMADRRYRPAGFTLPLGLKDLGLAEKLAAEAGVDIPIAPVLRHRFEAAVADPKLRDHDWSAIAELSRHAADH